MMSGLPAGRTTANRRGMRNSVIQLMLLIVALLACPDTPVMAYENAPAGGIYGHQHDFIETAEDGVPDDNSPTGSGSELLHHHHCPAGMIADETAVPANGSAPRETPLPRATAALASRATAPPTQPPSA